MKQAIFLFILTLFAAASVSADSGQYGQYGQYGGGSPSTSIIIDKMVSQGSTTKGGVVSYVDNYSPSDTRLSPGSKVYFQIKVKNTSEVTLKNVEVQDVLPAHLDAVEGPGTYDQNNKTISWTYPELKPNEEKIEKIIAQVYSQNRLPADKGLFCMTNKATAKVNNLYDDDTAQFCVEKQVALNKGGVPQTTPQAGAPGIALSVMSIVSLAGGLYIRRKS
jgi:uncharacterized repeat protein (TIGR01451 family)